MSTLYDRVRYRKYLFRAWQHVKRKGSKSRASARTRRLIEEFKQHSVRNLRRIYTQLHEDRYSFSPAYGKPIPKGGGEARPLAVPDLEDRIVQRSILEVLYDQKSVRDYIGHGRSFGGVPTRALDDHEGLNQDAAPRVAVPGAIEVIYNEIAIGGKYYIRSDIEGFFSNIPREEAIRRLVDLLPDDSLYDFLLEATQVELTNREKLGEYLDIFPDEVLGVAQGNSLSALLGNVLLGEFDRVLNSGPCTCVRYLDDFILIGPSPDATFESFERATEILSKFEMSVYDPEGSTGKADAGLTKTEFDYLGCQISKSFISPSKANRAKLKRDVRELLESRKMRLMQTDFEAEPHYGLSYVATLSELSKKLEAWANTYSFCNAHQVMRSLDEAIHEMVEDYIATYHDRRRRLDSYTAVRRMFGVRLLQDGNKDPIER